MAHETALVVLVAIILAMGGAMWEMDRQWVHAEAVAAEAQHRAADADELIKVHDAEREAVNDAIDACHAKLKAIQDAMAPSDAPPTPAGGS